MCSFTVPFLNYNKKKKPSYFSVKGPLDLVHDNKVFELLPNSLNRKVSFPYLLWSIVCYFPVAAIKDFKLIIAENHKMDKSAVRIALNLASRGHPTLQLMLAESLLQHTFSIDHIVQRVKNMSCVLHNCPPYIYSEDYPPSLFDETHWVLF